MPCLTHPARGRAALHPRIDDTPLDIILTALKPPYIPMALFEMLLDRIEAKR